jgi:hypothetical protein
MRAWKAILLALLLGNSASNAGANDDTTVWVDPSNSVDVYWNINLSGTVRVVADVDGRPACIDYWWIQWPLGSIKSLGRHCGSASFALPGLSDLAIGGKLRAGGAEVRTRIKSSATEKVAHDVSN